MGRTRKNAAQTAPATIVASENTIVAIEATQSTTTTEATAKAQSEAKFKDLIAGIDALSNHLSTTTLSGPVGVIRAGINGLSSDDDPTTKELLASDYLHKLVTDERIQALVKSGALAKDFYLMFPGTNVPAMLVDLAKRDGSLRDLNKYLQKKSKKGAITQVGYASEEDARKAIIDGRYLLVPCKKVGTVVRELRERTSGGTYMKKLRTLTTYQWKELFRSICGMSFLDELKERAAKREASAALREEWQNSGSDLAFRIWKKANNK